MENKYLYIFAYGSLVNSKNRNKSIKISKNNIIPAIISKNFGYVRSTKYPAMGIKKVTRNKKQINGILVKINQKELEILDKREFNYYRIKVPSKYISIYRDNDIFDKTLPIYIYKPKTVFERRSDNCSKEYLKVVEDGFKEYGNEFYKIYLSTTEGINNNKTKKNTHNKTKKSRSRRIYK